MVVGAHYDAFKEYPGADDNASGVAVLLEIARLLAKAPVDKMIATRTLKCEAQSQTTSTERPREQDRTFTLLGYVLYWRVTCPWWSRAGPYAKYRLEYPVATTLWRMISWVSRNGVFI